ncbi:MULTISPECIES: ParB/RepB/Spo0J family partition protein [unclassified Nodularia (in: cyanobacteria)]|uniref:ParB/RepB/Spo0J family partition protein n=1 Tax=unclassified Nodularia (in: cyanobacteria) TaxID=2656917 RepID=UPI00188088AA|nr:MULTISPECIES: ParB/RepB/Spo0J family partition protein [unclassified Nodularia (in: cyanobacteria)]MBE9202028.1 ParB/RepB/Spo0J family partition protein [Nodularia sp. LEGE 06071]MCC2694518.1 ParB/RepB/Spo0J family partition protein [Nodularia sp. LEGE 04288]
MRRTKSTLPLKSKIEVPWDTTDIKNADSSQSMPLEQINLPPTQPRRYFDSEALKQLTESIKQHGILQPLLVRPLDGEKHELVAGERRYRAAKEIGLKVVPVVIRELDDNAAFQLALIENLLREDLNPVEETEGILQLLAYKLNRNIEEIPTALYRLQREQKKASTVLHNVIDKDKVEGEASTHNVMGEVESDSITNVTGKEKVESETSTHNIMGEVESDSITNVTGKDKVEGKTSTHNVMGEVENDSITNVTGKEKVEGETSTHNVMGEVKNDSITNVTGKDKVEGEASTHNVMGETEKDNSVINQEPPVNPDIKIVSEVFDSLGLMTWESFVKNRLPLLNLTSDILEALRRGDLEYTKAKAIAQIQDKEERVAFLEQAIAQNWSLSEIKQRISEKKTPTSTPKTESNDYKERFNTATTKLRKSRIWSDPKKRKQIEKLLAQLETLTQVE